MTTATLEPDYSQVFYINQPDGFRVAVLKTVTEHDGHFDSYNGNGINVGVSADHAKRKALVEAIEAMGLFWDNAWRIGGDRIYRFTLS